MKERLHRNLWDNPKDLIGLLAAIEDHTGLYLLRRRLDYLEMFLQGYKRLAIHMKVELDGLDKLTEFSEYLAKEFDKKHPNSFGWFGYLCERYGDGEDGYNKFFEYWNLFLNKSTK